MGSDTKHRRFVLVNILQAPQTSKSPADFTFVPLYSACTHKEQRSLESEKRLVLKRALGVLGQAVTNQQKREGVFAQGVYAHVGTQRGPGPVVNTLRPHQSIRYKTPDGFEILNQKTYFTPAVA